MFNNYRNISLLNAAYKIYAKTVQTNSTISENILMEEQNGVRKCRSTINEIFSLQ